jgi:predicted Ser/Thr protein kinase
MIDFEKCTVSLEPKNVTQFCQFLITGQMSYMLREKGITLDREKLMAAAGLYKKDQKEKNFRALKKLVL